MIFNFIGPVSYLSYRTQCYLLGWLGCATLLANTCIPVQYFIRYRIIKQYESLLKLIKTQFSSNSPSILNIVLYFLVALSFALPFFYLTPMAYCSFDNPNQIDFSVHWHRELPIPQLFVGVLNQPTFQIHLVYLLIVQLSSYTLSIILARKSVSEIRKKSNRFSPKTKALQEQLAKYIVCFQCIKGCFLQNSTRSSTLSAIYSNPSADVCYVARFIGNGCQLHWRYLHHVSRVYEIRKFI